MAIPWSLFEESEEKFIVADVDLAQEEIFDDPPEEEEEVVIEEELPEEPVIQDYEVETVADEAIDSNSDSDPFMDSPFDSNDYNDVIGIGGGAGGKFSGRGLGKRGKRRGGAGTEQALADGLEWLKRHQAPDGSWDSDGFMDKCVTCPSEADGPGYAEEDVGVTGLALLAFLGDGNTTHKGPYKQVVNKSLEWLLRQQDHASGLFGEQRGHHFIYNHAIATLAISEAYYFSKLPHLRTPLRKAVAYIHEARDREGHGTWRYDVPSLGDSDTSITGWMVFALKSAEEAGINIEQEALADSLLFIEEMTDRANGRVGYQDVGSYSSRVDGVNSDYPVDRTESMTAVGLLCRIFLGQSPKDTPIMKKHADLLLRALPEYEMQGGAQLVDWYYWYYGSYAMYQMGGDDWKKWQRAMERAVVNPQRKDGDFKGSWDTDGPWAHVGGRVYTTALGVLCLEVYFRYAQVLGAR